MATKKSPVVETKTIEPEPEVQVKSGVRSGETTQDTSQEPKKGLDLRNNSLAREIASKQPMLVSGTNIKTINGQSLLGSGNLAVDGHFKGWWTDLATLKAAHTAVEGDSAYVKDASPATTWSIYVYDATATTDNNWADSGTDADTSNVQTFATGEEVNETPIDDTHLVNPADGAIAKAADVLQLKAKLDGVTATETKVAVVTSGDNQNIYDNGYVNGTDGTYHSSTVNKIVIVPVTGIKKVRFLGCIISSSSTINVGYSFGTLSSGTKPDSTLSNFTPSVFAMFDKYGSKNIAKEYKLTVPEGATWLCLTYWSSIVGANFYCYLMSGESVIESIYKEKVIDPKNLVGAVVGRNLFNKYTRVSNSYVDPNNGKFVSTSDSYIRSDYIAVEASTLYSGRCSHYAYYDARKVFISGASSNLSGTSPANAAYLVVDRQGTSFPYVYKGNANGVTRDTGFNYEVSLPWLKLQSFDVNLLEKFGAYYLNMFNKDDIVTGQFVNHSTGAFDSNADYFRSRYIPVKEGKTYYVSHPNRYSLYDSNYQYISGANLSSNQHTFTVGEGSGAKYVVVCNSPLTTAASYMLAEQDNYPASYESFGLVVPWIKPVVKKSKYDGYNMICLGDSITSDGYANTIKADTGINAVNCGFSSARYAQADDANQYVNAFALHNIVDAICTGDWTIPDTIIGVSGYETEASRIATLKATNFSNVQFVSFAYGTNDFSSATPFDNPNDPYDTNTFKGAIRYSIKTLLTAYPNIKIIGATPIYRFWVEGGVVVDDCDTHTIGGYKLIQYVEAIKEAYTDMHMPYVDNLTNAGINAQNRLYYFNITDGLHPKAVGRAVIGHRIASAILNEY